jgi:hypothetical protein
MNEMDSSLQKTTLEEKGDWKPIIFVFTDGNPTDIVDSAFEQWNKKYRKGSNLIIISIGDNADISILKQVSDNILILKDTEPESFKAFFKWVTASIKTNSLSVNETKNDGLHLAPITDENLMKIDLNKYTPTKIDENFAVILAKCQITKRFYLIKYQKRLSRSNSLNDMNVLSYKLVGAYTVDNNYFELSDDYQQVNQTINTDLLIGFPFCPCCGNQYGFSHCECGKIMCTGQEKINKCPWCEMEAEFGFASVGANITRTRG